MLYKKYKIVQNSFFSHFNPLVVFFRQKNFFGMVFESSVSKEIINKIKK